MLRGAFESSVMKSVAYFNFKVTPEGTPITIAAPIVLLWETFFSQPYSTIAPKEPNLQKKITIYKRQHKIKYLCIPLIFNVWNQ